jgi:hypothetical protein
VIRVLAAVIGVTGVAGLAAILEPNAYPSYDYAFALASAQDVLAGRGTGYEVPVYSPVSHPLTLLEALAVVPLGDLAFPVFTAVALLALGLLCLSVFRIGAAIASWHVGLLAAAIVFTSPVIFELSVRTYGDIAFAALMTAALALEIERPRRGWPVLAVLALAGLLRPEAWLFSAAYWLYLAPPLAWRDRIGLSAIAAAAPTLWLTADFLLTGDPLHSAEVARVYTEKADATTSPHDVWVAVRSLTGWPILVGALAGIALAWRRGTRELRLLLVVGAGAFAATVAPSFLGESPVLRRYLVVPGAVLSLLFAVACLGWTGSRSSAPAWRAAGTGLLLLAVVVLAGARADHWDGHRHAQERRVTFLEHLRRWATDTPQRAYLTAPGCRPIRVPGYAYRPFLRYWLDVPPRAVSFYVPDATPLDGIVLLPTPADHYQSLMLIHVGRQMRDNFLGDPRFSKRFHRVAATARWELYAGKACRRAVTGGVTARSS